MAPTANFLDLPPEVAQQVLADLPQTDLKAIRLTCSYLTELALKYLFGSIDIVHRSKDFARLRSIAERPDLCRYVRFLCYQADIFDVDHYQENDAGLDLWLCDCDAGRPRTSSFELSECSRNECFEHFEAFRLLCKDQASIREQGHDVRDLSCFMRKCTRLEKITLVFGAELGSYHYTIPYQSFPGLLYVPFDTVATLDQERPKSLGALARASSCLCQPLKTLEIVGLIDDDYDMDGAPGQLCSLLQGVRELHLCLHCDLDVEEDEPGLKLALEAASHTCTRLYLEMRDDDCYYVPRFHQHLADKTIWPMLQDLSVSNATVDVSFARFLTTCAPRLRYLNIETMHLLNGSLPTFFELLIGRLPELQRATLQGNFWGHAVEAGVLRNYGFEVTEVAIEQYLVQSSSQPDFSAAQELYVRLERDGQL